MRECRGGQKSPKMRRVKAGKRMPMGSGRVNTRGMRGQPRKRPRRRGGGHHRPLRRQIWRAPRRQTHLYPDPPANQRLAGPPEDHQRPRPRTVGQLFRPTRRWPRGGQDAVAQENAIRRFTILQVVGWGRFPPGFSRLPLSPKARIDAEFLWVEWLRVPWQNAK